MLDFNVASLIGTLGFSVMVTVFLVKGIQFFRLGIKFIHSMTATINNGGVDLEVIRKIVEDRNRRF